MISQITPGGLQPGDARQIHRRLGVARPHQHAAAARAQRKQVAGARQVARQRLRIQRHAHGGGAVRRRDAGAGAFARVDRHAHRGVAPRRVAADLERNLQMVQAFRRQRQADQATAIAGHEVDGLGRDLGRRHGQVALVLAVLVVHDHNHPPGANRAPGRPRWARTGPCAVAPLAIRICAAFHHRSLNPSTARATYFPTISHSRLTRSPARKDDKFVCRQVNGTIMTSNRAASSRATVRLTPLSGHRPLRDHQVRQAQPATRRRSNGRRRRRPRDRRPRWRPRGPAPGGPPDGVSARAARSRLTACDGRSAPSVVTRAVSGPMSALTSSPTMWATVRHTPSTDRLSPSVQLRRQRRVAARRRQPPGAAASCVDGADAFNQPGEHRLRSGRPAPAAPRGDRRASSDSARGRRRAAHPAVPATPAPRRAAPRPPRPRPTPRRGSRPRPRSRCCGRRVPAGTRAPRAGPAPGTSTSVAPARRRPAARVVSACIVALEVSMTTGPASSVVKRRAEAGVRRRRSNTTRVNGRSR